MAYNLKIPENYISLLTPRETEKAIRLIKDFFQTNLAFELNLTRVTAPLFVKTGTGINDDLNGIEKPVSFSIKNDDGKKAEIVQSLAKWKRMALWELGFSPGEGIYTDMNAVRPDDVLDNTHSIYVDQWDWERCLHSNERTISFLKSIVKKIYAVIVRTEKYLCYEFSAIQPTLPESIHFIHTEELEQKYPLLSPAQREYEICREYGAVFIIGVGYPLKSGIPHDGRAPDYDDWSTGTDTNFHGLNGDIFVYNAVLDCAYELSSMGIRVNKESLLTQLQLRNCMERKELLFHKLILNDTLPFSIGGGIGQSRLCMFYLRKAHIGEIQASIWPEKMGEECKRNNIFLL